MNFHPQVGNPPAPQDFNQPSFTGDQPNPLIMPPANNFIEQPQQYDPQTKNRPVYIPQAPTAPIV
jgi:hypothetical protein|tara:strand:- start:84 stop:278 length:195 start_codon:yes stop_codon:yes gene_type:complete